MEYDVFGSKAEALSEIAKAQAEAGEKDAAMSTFEAAKETAGAIEDAWSKADALREIAKAQAEASEDAKGVRPKARGD